MLFVNTVPAHFNVVELISSIWTKDKQSRWEVVEVVKKTCRMNEIER